MIWKDQVKFRISVQCLNVVGQRGLACGLYILVVLPLAPSPRHVDTPAYMATLLQKHVLDQLSGPGTQVPAQLSTVGGWPGEEAHSGTLGQCLSVLGQL